MAREPQRPQKRATRRQKQYKRTQHQRASRLITKLDELVREEKLIQLNFSDTLVRAVEAQKKRQRLAAAGNLQCYEKFSGDPNYYIYNVDPVSGTMTSAEPPYQSQKPNCRACTN